MADKPRIPSDDAGTKPAGELSPAAKSGHDVLFAKMDALVGRQRAEGSNDGDEIPVLTEIVAPGAGNESHAASLRPNAAPAPVAEPPIAAGTTDLTALLRAHLVTALTQQFGEHLQPQLQAQIANAVRDVLARESEQLALRIAERVGELMQARLNIKG